MVVFIVLGFIAIRHREYVRQSEWMSRAYAAGKPSPMNPPNSVGRACIQRTLAKLPLPLGAPAAGSPKYP